MAKSQTLADHVSALREQIHAAMNAREEEAKPRIDAAIKHADAARADLKARTTDASAKAKQHIDATMAHLNDVASEGKKALNERGEQFKWRLAAMALKAEAAVKSQHEVSKV